MVYFGAKRPGEAVTLAFDFSRALPAGVVLEAALGVTVEVLRGEDATPGDRLVGAPALAGADLLQRFDGGVLGADYLVVARVRFTDQQVRELAAVLSVRRLI